MAKRVCRGPGCPTLVEAGTRDGRCSPCRSQAEAERGSRADRGYGHEHQVERIGWQQLIDRGERVDCWRCGNPIQPGEEWHLGHDDHDRSVTRGPEHARRCNLAAAGRARHRAGPSGGGG